MSERSQGRLIRRRIVDRSSAALEIVRGLAAVVRPILTEGAVRRSRLALRKLSQATGDR